MLKSAESELYNTMKKMVIVDGNSLMHRAYHALPPMNDAQGTPTQAVYGFLSMLLKIIEQEKPTHILIAFDTKAPTPRHKEYVDYKAGRKPTDDDLRVQFPIVKDVLKEMHIAVGEQDGYEADDFLGIFSRRAEAADCLVTLVTGDKDALQLITDKTIVLLTRKGISQTELMDTNAIQAQYGVTPKDLIEVKGLMGDSSDNIPGIAGIGEKTALKLIKEYGTVENVISHADDVSGKVLREKIKTQADQARMSRNIGTIVIDTDAPIKLTVEDCQFNKENMLKALPILQSLGLRTISNRLTKLENGSAETVISDIPTNTISHHKLPARPFAQLLDSEEKLQSWIHEQEQTQELAIVWKDNISISDGQSLWIIPLKENMLSDGFDVLYALDLLKPIFESKQITKRVYDAKHWMHELNQYHITVQNVTFDAMIAAYLLNPNNNKATFDTLIEDYYGLQEYDASILYFWCDALREQMNSEEVLSVFETIEMPLVSVLYDMEQIGCLLDQNLLRELGVGYDQQIAVLENEIYLIADETFNIASPKQLGVILFEKMELPVQKKTKTGYSTDAETLETLKEYTPIAEKIIEYRTLSKLKSTYIDGLLDAVHEDGRVHSTFKQTITATGRISSTDPNLQNIPTRTEVGREIRKAFIAPDGYMLVGADYSQIELRVLAHIAQDETMIQSFLHNEDIHARTAAEVADISLEEVTSDMRSAAKAVNFGIVYGISDFGLSKQLSISRQKAKEYIAKYLEEYNGISRYMVDIVEKAKENGYATTLLGRRRPLPELQAKNHNVRSFGERAAMNAPIQGTAADIIKLAMIQVSSALQESKLKARLILQIHDELLIETPMNEVEQVEQLVHTTMMNVMSLCVPLEVDVHSGVNWYEAK